MLVHGLFPPSRQVHIAAFDLRNGEGERGDTIQAPGATGTDHRLHIAMDLVSLQFIEVLVSDVHTGETLKHFTLAPGDVAVAHRGYAQCQGMSTALQQGLRSSYGLIRLVWS